MNPELRRAVLIPAYRAERTVGGVVARLRELHPDLHVLVVDDGSGDATAENARVAGAQVFSLPTNTGKGSALAAGLMALREQGFQWALAMDSDGQHLPEDASKFLLATFSDTCGLVVGARRLHPGSMPLPRVCSNRLTTALLELQAGTRLWDSQCGYRMYRLEAVAAANVPAMGRFEWESEAMVRIARAGYDVQKVDIATVYGDEGSHIRPWRDTGRFVRLWFRLWRVWWRTR
ncbi:MAG TPA: glycosyltransferase family 2 protein [Fibrobacteria bacterium]|nr:glycosyltransferase family 2 protein [Fibrobacteria bacterium]